MGKVIKGIISFFKYLWTSLNEEDQATENHGDYSNKYGTPKPFSHWSKLSEDYRDIQKADLYLRRELAKESRPKVTFEELVQYRRETDEILRKTRNYA